MHADIVHGQTGIYSEGYITAKQINEVSDIRLKTIIKDIVIDINDIANAPSFIFSWKDNSGIDIGTSAQYWKQIVPQSVKELNNSLNLSYSNLALINTISIAKKTISIEDRVNQLELENK